MTCRWREEARADKWLSPIGAARRRALRCRRPAPSPMLRASTLVPSACLLAASAATDQCELTQGIRGQPSSRPEVQATVLRGPAAHLPCPRGRAACQHQPQAPQLHRCAAPAIGLDRCRSSLPPPLAAAAVRPLTVALCKPAAQHPQWSAACAWPSTTARRRSRRSNGRPRWCSAATRCGCAGRAGGRLRSELLPAPPLLPPPTLSSAPPAQPADAPLHRGASQR